MAKQNKASVANQGPLPKGGMRLGAHGGSGVLDTSTLPKPTLPQWDGWSGIKDGRPL